MEMAVRDKLWLESWRLGPMSIDVAEAEWKQERPLGGSLSRWKIYPAADQADL